MSFASQTQKSKIYKTQSGAQYFIEIDENSEYYRVVGIKDKNDYDSNFGTVIYEESVSRMSKNGSTLENVTDKALQNYGGVAFANRARNIVGAAYKGSYSRDDLSQFDGAWWVADRNTAPATPTSSSGTGTAAGADVQTQIQEGLDQATIGLNQDRAKDLAINTASLPQISKASLRYPEDLDMNIQDTLMIHTFKYEPARGLPTIDQATDNARFLRTASIDSKGGRRSKILSTIILPIPNAVGDSNSVAWGGGQFSSVAGTLGGEINNAIFGSLGAGPDTSAWQKFEDISNTVAGGITGAIRGAGQLISNPYVQRKALLDNLAAAAAKLGVNVDVTQVITRTGGVVENPNLELLFTGPSLRTFQFTVRFTPRSPSESAVVRKIIRVLKQHSAVKKGVTLGTVGFDNKNLLLGTPDVFVLKYIQAGPPGQQREIKGLTKMKTCALTNLSVDYTGEAGRWAAYDGDSQPVTTLVTMNFSELAPIYDTDYINSFGDEDSIDDVGF